MHVCTAMMDPGQDLVTTLRLNVTASAALVVWLIALLFPFYGRET